MKYFPASANEPVWRVMDDWEWIMDKLALKLVTGAQGDVEASSSSSFLCDGLQLSLPGAPRPLKVDRNELLGRLYADEDFRELLASQLLSLYGFTAPLSPGPVPAPASAQTHAPAPTPPVHPSSSETSEPRVQFRLDLTGPVGPPIVIVGDYAVSVSECEPVVPIGTVSVSPSDHRLADVKLPERYYTAESPLEDAGDEVARVEDASIEEASVKEAGGGEAGVDEAGMAQKTVIVGDYAMSVSECEPVVTIDTVSVSPSDYWLAEVDLNEIYYTAESSLEDAGDEVARVEDAGIEEASIEDAVEQASIEEHNIEEASVEEASVKEAVVGEAGVNEAGKARKKARKARKKAAKAQKERWFPKWLRLCRRALD